VTVAAPITRRSCWLHCYAATRCKAMQPTGGVALQSYPATRFNRIPPPVSDQFRQSAKAKFSVSQNADFRGVGFLTSHVAGTRILRDVKLPLGTRSKRLLETVAMISPFETPQVI
jgi:hypothetical protein